MEVDTPHGETTANDDEFAVPQPKRPKLSEQTAPESSRPSGLPPGFFDKQATPQQDAQSHEEDEEEVEVDEEAIQAVLKTMRPEDLVETKVVRTRANLFDPNEIERELEREFNDSNESQDDEDEDEGPVSHLPTGFFDAGNRPKQKPKPTKPQKTVSLPQKSSVEYADAPAGKKNNTLLIYHFSFCFVLYL